MRVVYSGIMASRYILEVSDLFKYSIKPIKEAATFTIAVSL